MGGNVTKQLAKAKITNIVENSISMSFKSVQRNTSLAANTQLVNIRQRGGLFQVANVSQKSNQQLGIAAFATSGVQAELVSQIMNNIKSAAAQDAKDSSLLQGFMSKVENSSELEGETRSAMKVAVDVVTEQVNQQSSLSDQGSNISQLSEPGRLTLLQSADVSQESSQTLFIKSMTDSLMSSSIVSKLESQLENKMDQRITNPIEGIAEAAANGLWAMMLALMSPVLVPIVIVGVALAFILVSWLRAGPTQAQEQAAYQQPVVYVDAPQTVGGSRYSDNISMEF
jgi:hypothetical protein